MSIFSKFMFPCFRIPNRVEVVEVIEENAVTYNVDYKLSFSAVRNLQMVAQNRKPEKDLMLALYDGEEEVGRTESVHSMNGVISWSKKINVKYSIGANKKLKLRVYSADSNSQPPHSPSQVLDERECDLSQILMAKASGISLKFINSSQIDTLTIKAEENQTSRSFFVKIDSCSSHSLNEHVTKGFCLKIYGNDAEKMSNGILITNVVTNNPNPYWSVCLNLEQICSMDDKFYIDVWRTSNRNNSSSGSTACGNWTILRSNIENPLRLKSKDCDCQLSMNPTNSFLDMIKRNYELELMLGLDFSAKYDSTLETLYNDKKQIISNISMAMKCLTVDECFRTLCFGGKIKANGATCFCLNQASGDETTERALNGKETISALEKAQVDRGTQASLCEYIEKALVDVDVASTKYRILITIMNGHLINVEETIDSLKEASGKPVSIIFVDMEGDDTFKRKLAENENLLGDRVRLVPWRELPVAEECKVEYLLKDVPEQLYAYHTLEVLGDNNC